MKASTISWRFHALQVPRLHPQKLARAAAGKRTGALFSLNQRSLCYMGVTVTRHGLAFARPID